MLKDDNAIYNSTFWNDRYAKDGYLYGKKPNDFLCSQVNELKTGNVLCLAEGEGRNAVFLAAKGFDVTVLDLSAIALKKAQQLADENRVNINTVHADLSEYTIEKGQWDNIVAIFMHLPAEIRKKVYTGVQQGLVDGGVFLTEVYRPAQLNYASGGPKDKSLLIPLDTMKAEVSGLEPVFAQETMREIIEGRGHLGNSAVTQFIGRKCS